MANCAGSQPKLSVTHTLNQRRGLGLELELENKAVILSLYFFFFVLNEGNAHTDANCALLGMKAGGFLSNTVGDDGQQ